MGREASDCFFFLRSLFFFNTFPMALELMLMFMSGSICSMFTCTQPPVSVNLVFLNHRKRFWCTSHPIKTAVFVNHNQIVADLKTI